MSFYKIRPRCGTKEQWETANTVLSEREIGFELPSGGVGTGEVKMKMGNGVSTWNTLPYAFNLDEIIIPDDRGVENAWNDSTSYNEGDYVIYNNNVWKALIANNNVNPTEGTHWERVSLKKLSDGVNNLKTYAESLIQTSTYNFEEKTIAAKTRVSLTFDVSSKIPSGYKLLFKIPHVRWFSGNNVKDITFSGTTIYTNATSGTLDCYSTLGCTANVSLFLVCVKI